MTKKRPVTDPAARFTPAEHMVLSQWFGVPPLVTEPGVTPKRALRSVLRSVELGDGLDMFEDRLPAGVAAVVLKHVQDELPTWAVVTPAGMTITRRTRRPKQGVPVGRPALLFGINWATSASGYDWPAAFYVTLVPGYNRYVVTESADSPEAMGACDLALGHFEAGGDRVKESRDLIAGIWKSRWPDPSLRFQEFRSEGLLDEAAVTAMADEVWGKDEH